MPVPPGTMNPAVRLVQGPTGKVLHEENSRTALAMMATDAEARKLPQFVATFTATLGALCAGTAFAWSSTALKILKDNKTVGEEAASWISSCMTLGAFAGCLFAGVLADKLGRQRTLLMLSVPLAVSYLLLALPAALWSLFLGRIIGGVAIGAVSVVTGMYVSEISEPSVRGTLGSFFQLQITIGILVGYIVGLVKVPSHMAYIHLSLPLFFAAVFARMPESPAFLLSKGRSERARDALQWLRGPQYDISEEIATIRHSIMESQQTKASVADLFGSRAVVRGMIVALGLMGAQQLSGVNAVFFYSSDIFASTGSALSTDLCNIIIGVVQVLSTYVSTVLVDRAGRRVLLLLSSGVMAICLGVLATFFHLQQTHRDDVSGITWLPLVAIAVFIVMFSLGLGPLPWCIVSEIFSNNVKGQASSIACAANWLMAFLVTKVFQNLVDAIGQSGTFFVFCAIAVLGTIFIAFVVPETKGKTIEEIQAELGGRKGCPLSNGVPQAIDEEDEEDPACRTFAL